MRLPIIIRHIGAIFLFTGIFLAISLVISLVNRDGNSLIFAYCTLLSLLFGLFPIFFVPPSFESITPREGIAIVVAGWFLICLLGALPFLLHGGDFNLINAWYESVSGFTTTGASILGNVETLPQSLLFWRSSTHWIGGLGVILFTLILLPGEENSRLVLMSTELSTIARQNFRMSRKKILRILFFVYIGLTLTETILLSLCGMSLFDAVNHSFATIATGGFSTKNASIGFYGDARIEVIVMVFMTLSGLNFGLIFGTVMFRSRNIFTSSVSVWFVLILLISVTLVTADLIFSGYGGVLISLRHAAFQVISLGTTSGFATADSTLWPAFTQLILIYLTLQCACVGSTSGGLKFDRVFIFFKSLAKQLRLIRHPQAVVVVKIDGQPVPSGLELQTMVFYNTLSGYCTGIHPSAGPDEGRPSDSFFGGRSQYWQCRTGIRRGGFHGKLQPDPCGGKGCFNP